MYDNYSIGLLEVTVVTVIAVVVWSLRVLTLITRTRPLR
jgi:hypothetical protein